MNGNPLSEIINDEQYNKLLSEGYLNTLRIRDKNIKERYKELRQSGKKLSASDCIEQIREEEYQYLTFESIRKIIMTNGKREKH